MSNILELLSCENLAVALVATGNSTMTLDFGHKYDVNRFSKVLKWIGTSELSVAFAEKQATDWRSFHSRLNLTATWIPKRAENAGFKNLLSSWQSRLISRAFRPWFFYQNPGSVSNHISSAKVFKKSFCLFLMHSLPIARNLQFTTVSFEDQSG